MSKMTSKEKLDNALGISSGSSFDELLDTLTLDTAQTTIQTIDKNVTETLSQVNSEIISLSADNTAFDITNINQQLSSINELIDVAKSVLTHLYKNIITTDVTLVDPELINATATFISSCRDSIKEWIDLYKDHVKFLNKIQIMMLEQKHKKELLDYKYSLESKLKNEGSQTPQNMRIYRQEDLVKLIDSVN